MTELMNVDDALARILSSIARLEPETVPLAQALDRVLAHDISAGVDVPPFPTASMDGFGVIFDDVASATQASPVQLRVIADVPAGRPFSGSIERGSAVRIMTGALVPETVDTIIPVEATDANWRDQVDVPLEATVTIRQHSDRGANIRWPGESIRRGQSVLRQGTLVSPAVLGLLASLGVDQVEVVRRPRVAILSTGDELVPPGQALQPGQIYESNGPTLAALVQTHGGEPILMPLVRDSANEVRLRFEQILALKPDAIITSAGVSVGTADYVRDTIAHMGELALWRINLRPGKPLAYGHIDHIPIFGLPGNPVSVMVTFDVLVRPALLTMAGHTVAIPLVEATLQDMVYSDGRRTYVRVQLMQDAAGTWRAALTGTQSSGALISMALADGLMILPEGTRIAHPGERHMVRLLRPVEAIAADEVAKQG